jgi:outer membrane protein TolC
MNKRPSFLFSLCGIACLAVPLIAEAQLAQPVPLKDAVNAAMRNSRDVAVAEARYNVAGKTVTADRAAFRPNLYTGSGAAYTYGFPQTPSGAAPSIINLSYIQSLYNPLQTALVRSAQEEAEVQRLELEKTRNSIALQTTSAYLDLEKVRHSLELARGERQSHARISNFTEQRVREGFELPTERTQADLAAARTELLIARLEGTESDLQRRLASLMGLPPGQRIEVATDSLSLETGGRENDIIDRAVANSIELRQSEYDRRSKEHIVIGQDRSKWPTIDFVGEYGLFGRYNNFQDYFRTFQPNNFTVGLQIRIPLISAQRKSNLALAVSELSLSETQLKNTRQTVEIQTSREYQRVRELNAAREVSRLEFKLAQESLRQIQANFEEGRANFRDVERARLNENDKWMAFLDSDTDLKKAQAELLSATGELSKIFQ